VQEGRQQHSAVMAAIEAIGPYVLGLSADDVRRIEDGARGETEAVRRAAVDAVGRWMTVCPRLCAISCGADYGFFLR
jgi:hypothetical protein